MKRTEFLKRIIGLPMTAAAVAMLPEPAKVLQPGEPDYLTPFGLNYFYSTAKYNLGDEITSDMGDKAIITHINRTWGRTVHGLRYDKYTQYVFRPKIMGQFRWRTTETNI